MGTVQTQAGNGTAAPSRFRWLRAARFATPILLQACAVAPSYLAPTPALPAAYHTALAMPDLPLPSLDAWWEGFGDAHLNALVGRVVDRNYDISRALARVDQANALVGSARANAMPRGDAVASAGLARLSKETELGRIEKQIPGFAWNGESLDAGARVSWDPDLFGSLKRSADAADARLEASQADVIGVRLQAIARLVDIYIDERTLEARLALVEQEAQLSRQTADLVALKVERGVTPAQALSGLRSETEQVEAEIPRLEAAIARCRNTSATLAADSVDTDAWVEHGTDAPLSIPGISLADGPASLLRRRPDIIAAERRLAAADSDIAVAIAEYYPHVSVLGALGLASTLGHRLLTADAAYADGGLGMHWRLFDFGRVDAQVAYARGEKAEALAAYRSSVLHATEQVETGAVLWSRSLATIDGLAEAERSLQSARDAQDSAYQRGASSALEVLALDLRLTQLKERELEARAGALHAAAAVFTALGGGWPAPRKSAQN